MVTWLELEPDRSAKELFARLCGDPGVGCAVGQPRTLQRKVKNWRYLPARRLPFVPSIGTAERVNTDEGMGQ